MINEKNYMLEEAEEIIEERRIKANSEVLKREELLSKDNDYISACNKKGRLTVEIAEKLYNNEPVNDLYEKLKDAEKEIIEAQKKHGITPEMMKPDFTCKICNDTGYIGGEKCVCLKKVYNKLLIKESNINFEDYPFVEDIDKNYYSGENTKKGLEIIKELVNKIDDTKYTNFLIMGKSGIGKTYIMKSFAKSLVEQNKTVLYLTAFGLNNLFLEMTLGGYEVKSKILKQLLDVDLLIIDDLGTEQIYKNVTVENLYNIIDERMSTQKAIMLSTNLTQEEIIDRYDIRIYSRLFHKEKSLKLLFDGKDLRR